MTSRPILHRLALALSSFLLFSGCHNDAETDAGKSAEQAVGLQPGSKSTKSVEYKREVVVEKEERVVDPKTGEVLSDKKSSTPVTITQDKEVKTDVKVNVGDPSPAKK